MPIGSAEPVTAAEANRRLYAEIAATYDVTESCVVEPRLRGRLAHYLDCAHELLGDRPSLSALDACGGSGNASLMLLERGVRPLTVDVSPEMLALYERKARAAGHEPRTKVAEIEPLLEREEARYDLIVFASALHHLAEPRRAVELALSRLAPGGVLVTAFDPINLTPAGLRLRRADYAAYVVLTQPERLAGIVRRRLSGDGGDHGHGHDHAGHSIGALAERHAVTGIDDRELAAAIERQGARVVLHDRYFQARLRPVRAVLRRLDRPTNFGLVAQVPAG